MKNVGIQFTADSAALLNALRELGGDIKQFAKVAEQAMSQATAGGQAMAKAMGDVAQASRQAAQKVVADLKAQAAQEQANIDALRQRAAALGTAAEAANKLKKAQSDAAAAKAAYDALEAQRNDAAQAEQRVRKVYELREAITAAKNATTAAIEAERTAAKDAISAKQAQITALREAGSATKDNVAAIRAEIAALKEARDVAIARARAAQGAKVSGLQADISAVDNTAAGQAARQAMIQANKTLAETQRQVNAESTAAAKLQQQLAQAEAASAVTAERLARAQQLEAQAIAAANVERAKQRAIEAAAASRARRLDDLPGLPVVATSPAAAATLQQTAAAAAQVATNANAAAAGVQSLGRAAREAAAPSNSLMEGLKVAFIGGGIAAAIITIKNTLAGMVGALVDAQVQADKLRLTFNGAVGAESGAAELKFIRQEADRLGVSYKALATQYSRFVAATKDTQLQGETTRRIFSAMAEATARFGLSVEESEGVFRALTQMVSKGQIQAEELRGQLGERLPGAFKKFADSMGKSTAELSKALELGDVGIDRLGPFAEFLRKDLAENAPAALQTLGQEINRLGNTWDRFKTAIVDSGIGQAIKGTVTGVTAVLDFFTRRTEEANRRQAQYAKQALEEAQARLKLLEELPNGRSPYVVANIAATRELVKSLQEAYDAKKRLLESDDIAPARQRLETFNEPMFARALGKEQDRLAFLAFMDKLNPKTKDYQEAIDKLNLAEARGVVTAAEKAEALKLIGEKYGNLKEQASAYKTILDSINKKGAESKLELQNGRQLTEAEKFRADLYERINSEAAKLGAKQSAELRNRVDVVAKEIELLEVVKRREKENAKYYAEREENEAALAQFQSDLAKSAAANTVAALDAARAAKDQAAMVALEETLLGATNLQRAQAIEQLRMMQRIEVERERLNRMAFNTDEERQAALARFIATAEQERETAVRSVQIEDFKRTFEQIGDALAEEIMRGGKSAGQLLKNYFKTLVLQPIIKAIVNPVAAGITGITGSLGLGATAAQAGQGGLSALSNLAGLSSLTSAFGTSFSAGLTSAISSGFATTGLALEGGLAMVAEGTAASMAAGFGQIAGTLGPYAAAAAALYMVYKSLDKSGTQTRGADVYSAGTTVVDPLAGTVANWGSDAGFQANRVAQTEAFLAPLALSSAKALNALSALTGGTQKFAVGLQFATDGVEDTRGAIKLFADGAVLAAKEQLKFTQDLAITTKEFTGELALSMVDAIKQTIPLPAMLADELEALRTQVGGPTIEAIAAFTDRVVGLMSASKQMADAFAVLPGSFANVAGLTDELRIKLADLFGGFQAAGAAIDAYYQAFYSETERAAATTAQLTKSMAALGLSMPASRDAFRALVDAQDLTTESGRKTYAALIGLSGAFAQVTAQAQTAQASALRAANAEIASAIASMRSQAESADSRVLQARKNIFGAYTNAVSRLKSLLDQSAQATAAFGASIEDVLRSLNQDAAISPYDERTRFALLAQEFEDVLAKARLGDQGARDRLAAVAQDYLRASMALAETDVEYATTAARVQQELIGVLNTLPKAQPTGGATSIDQQIQQAREEVATLLTLVGDTGSMAAASADSVAAQAQALRAEYTAAVASQIEAAGRLATATAALSSLGLSEAAVQALSAGLASGASAYAQALGVSDEAIATLQSALGLDDTEVQAAAEALKLQAAQETYARLAQSLGVSVDQVKAMAAALGVDALTFERLTTVLGIGSAQADELAAILGLSDAERAALAAALGVATPQIDLLSTSLGVDPKLINTLLTSVGLSNASAQTIGSLPTVLGFGDAARRQIEQLAQSVGLSPAVVTTLAQAAALRPDVLPALASALGVSNAQLGDLRTALGYSAATGGALATALGLQSGLSAALATSLGLSSSAVAAIGELGRIAASIPSSITLVQDTPAAADPFTPGMRKAIRDASAGDVAGKAALYATLRNVGFDDAALQSVVNQEVGSQSAWDWAELKRVAGFANGGVHEGGWRVVGERGPELAYTGPEQIFSNQQSRSLMDTSALEAQLERVTQELEGMRAEMRATAINTSKAAGHLERVTDGGQDYLRVVNDTTVTL